MDSKGFLGVMNPGEGKVHRDCAVRCISGGIPPGFVTDDFNGTSRIWLLTDGDGNALSKKVRLDKVAQPVEIHGRVQEHDGLVYLQTDPKVILPLRERVESQKISRNTWFTKSIFGWIVVIEGDYAAAIQNSCGRSIK